MGGIGKERIKDDKGCLSNLYCQTSKPPKIYLWAPEFHSSTLKIQSDFTIAGGNVQRHTVIYRYVYPLTQPAHFQESIPQNNWPKTTRREWEDKPEHGAVFVKDIW